MLSEMPVCTLRSGATVGNFSSPHPFTFDDGTVLAACQPDRVNGLLLKQEEIEEEGLLPGLTDVRLRFLMTEELIRQVVEDGPKVDILLVPFPFLEAWKASGDGKAGNLRVIRTVDRVTKVISATKFCV